MAHYQDNRSVWTRVDWLTILFYLALMGLGWVSICGACYDFDNTSLVSLTTRSGMQLVWIGSSILIAAVILLTDDRIFDTLSFLIYAGMLLLLIVTIFIAPDTKGSRSWIRLGSFGLQPAEFAKFATALAVAKLMNAYNFSIQHRNDFVKAALIVLLPMVIIIAQKETGSALVYFAFFLMFYREGMPGSILFVAVIAVIYFVIGIKFQTDHMFNMPVSAGTYLVHLIILASTLGLLKGYTEDAAFRRTLTLYALGTTALCLCFSCFVLPHNIIWEQIAIILCVITYLCFCAIKDHVVRYAYIALFALGSIVFFYSSHFVLYHVMQPHQQVRIEVLLGIKDDTAGAGYNVNQSKIAIGSGGLEGKGFLNGTQTKLKYVPEQETDFIFCTVGEEQGFVGAAAVLLLFLALIFRLIVLSERQETTFGRVYGYSVVSIFLFHVFINVGMVLGLTPVIGIPLPFFSYGGSSLWGFTILLFVFLRIDAGRNQGK